jgi:membrane-associated protease RseP (regulator of RpoE activity)
MGQPSSELPPLPPGELFSPAASPYPPPKPPPPRQREPLTRYIILFILTLVTTTLTGVDYYLSFESGLSPSEPIESLWAVLPTGLWYSLSVLAILGAHEFGHYFACVYYRVNASLPYFLPMPLVLTGTLGAVIRIRQPMPGKRALFDIGIAGPLAGFAVALPLLVVGMSASKIVAMPSSVEGPLLELGEPMLFKMVAWLTFGSVPDGYTIVLHPIGFAAWFGLLATALNLFPISQLDGGHISYAVFGRKSTVITLTTVAALIGLSFVSMSWIVWSVLTVVMLIALGPHHPRVFDEHLPLDRTRLWLAAAALLVFVVCFTPAPIELLDLVGN